MPPGVSLQSDFTAGELSPSLSARVDFAKYVKGCRTLRNFLVQPHGGAVKRPGFELLDELPGPAVLVPFVFNQDQAYCLCFGGTQTGEVISGGEEKIVNGTFDQGIDGWETQNVVWDANTGSMCLGVLNPLGRSSTARQSFATIPGNTYFVSIGSIKNDDGSDSYMSLYIGSSLNGYEYLYDFAYGGFSGVFIATGDTAYVYLTADFRKYKPYVDDVSIKEGIFKKDSWMRVATHDGFVLGPDGQTPYEIPTPYTYEEAKQISYVQSADVLFIAHQKIRPQTLKRLGHTEWAFEPMEFTAPLSPPGWDTISFTPSPPATITPASPVGAAFVNGALKSDGTLSSAQRTTPYNYFVTAVSTEGKESPLSAEASIDGPASNNWQAGDYMILQWLPVSGAAEYRVYKSSFGGRPGYVATTGGTSWKDYNVLPSLSEGAPNYQDPFPLGDYPGAVALFEQRLVFASTPNRPQTIWMSKSGDYGNFATYVPIAADSPIEMTIASSEVSAAAWLVALRSLILGSSDMEWEISGAGEAAFSATNKKATPQSYWGSSLKQALIIGNIVLHVSSSGSQVRSLQYEFAADSYGGMDLSILADHLFVDRIDNWAYQRNPDSIVWAVRSDGVLLGLTFQAEHQIAAWHRHDTQGKFRSVCSTPHGFEYSLFVVIERNGVFYLERMAQRYKSSEAARAVFLDCSLTYDGPPTKTVSGLDHLEGKTVGILADAAVMAPRIVENGQITLDNEASVVTVGLQYTADLETMPVEVVSGDGASVALKKQINAVDIVFRNSMDVRAGLSFGKMEEIKWRANEPYGVPPAPFSGIKQIITSKLADNILTVCLRSDSPTPVAVLAIVSRIKVNAQ